MHMKYILLIHHEEKAWSNLTEDERRELTGEYMQLTQELTSSGKYLGGAPLHPTATASSVRVRNGKRLVTDGPFAETREQLGGYFLVEAASQEEAIEIAARIPGARTGTVEVRQVLEVPVPAPA
jgi:hypothetical protein